jgi:hypothetical protein
VPACACPEVGPPHPVSRTAITAKPAVNADRVRTPSPIPTASRAGVCLAVTLVVREAPNVGEQLGAATVATTEGSPVASVRENSGSLSCVGHTFGCTLLGRRRAQRVTGHTEGPHPGEGEGRRRRSAAGAPEKYCSG